MQPFSRFTLTQTLSPCLQPVPSDLMLWSGPQQTFPFQPQQQIQFGLPQLQRRFRQEESTTPSQIQRLLVFFMRMLNSLRSDIFTRPSSWVLVQSCPMQVATLFLTLNWLTYVAVISIKSSIWLFFSFFSGDLESCSKQVKTSFFFVGWSKSELVGSDTTMWAQSFISASTISSKEGELLIKSLIYLMFLANDYIFRLSFLICSHMASIFIFTFSQNQMYCCLALKSSL